MSKVRDPYVDEIAVELASYGQRVSLTVAEQGELISKLTRAGYSSREIAERVGLHPRTVIRYRQGQVLNALPSTRQAEIERRTTMERLAEGGLKSAQIAEQLGVCKVTVQRRLRGYRGCGR